jgi:hypothetical protein
MKSQTKADKSPAQNLNNHIIAPFLLFWGFPPHLMMLPSGIWHCIVGSLVHDVLKEHSALIFKGQAIHISHLLILEYKGTALPQISSNHFLNNTQNVRLPKY